MHINDVYDRIEEALYRVILQHTTDYFFGRGRRPKYIEVGSNDGVSSSKTIDFVRHHEWSGLSIEPVPHVFENLKNNLAPHPRVEAIQAAISDRPGTMPFYQVVGKDDKSGDVRFPMMSSFDKGVILKQAHVVPNIDRYIDEIAVQVRTIADLCDERGISDFDILLTDAEGHDDTIVMSVDFDRYRPSLVAVEHIHISPDRMRALDAYLMRFGYVRCIMWMDTMWFRGDLLREEPIQRMIRTMPTFIPEYQPTYGNGYWFSA